MFQPPGKMAKPQKSEIVTRPEGVDFERAVLSCPSQAQKCDASPLPSLITLTSGGSEGQKVPAHVCPVQPAAQAQAVSAFSARALAKHFY